MIWLITLAAATRDNIPDDEAAALRSRGGGGRYVKQHNWAWCLMPHICYNNSFDCHWLKKAIRVPTMAYNDRLEQRERERERERVSGLCAASLGRFLLPTRGKVPLSQALRFQCSTFFFSLPILQEKKGFTISDTYHASIYLMTVLIWASLSLSFYIAPPWIIKLRTWLENG